MFVKICILTHVCNSWFIRSSKVSHANFSVAILMYATLTLVLHMLNLVFLSKFMLSFVLPISKCKIKHQSVGSTVSVQYTISMHVNGKRTFEGIMETLTITIN